MDSTLKYWLKNCSTRTCLFCNLVEISFFIFFIFLLSFSPFLVARKLWRDYFASGVDGVVFIVDAVDRARFPEAKKELDVSIRNFYGRRFYCILPLFGLSFYPNLRPAGSIVI